MRVLEDPMELVPEPLAIKAELACSGAAAVVRRVRLPSGSTTGLEEAIALLEERFGVRLLRSLTYVDADGDVVTVSSDAELQDALSTLRGQHLRCQVSRRSPEDEEGWEVIPASSSSLPPRAASEEVQLAPPRPSTSWASDLQFWLNGERVLIQNPSPDITLLEWLRESRRLVGAHVGCGEGGCGICTVAGARLNPESKRVETVSLNSCLRRLCGVDGYHILTTHGLGCKRDGFHDVQTGIADGNGVQCGFCTPGWVMGMYALLQRSPTPSKEEVERSFDGNLCRCTGYRPILTAFGKFAEGGSSCKQRAGTRHPPELLAHELRPLRFTDAKGNAWYRPVALAQLQDAFVESVAAGQQPHIICAGTSDGVVKYMETTPADSSVTCKKAWIETGRVPELQGVAVSSSGVRCGAAVPLVEFVEVLSQEAVSDLGFKVLAEHAQRVASVPIRNVASLVGNVMLARAYQEFPSDMVTVLSAAGATVRCLIGLGGASPEQKDVLVPDLLNLQGDILVLSVFIPRVEKGAVYQTFRTAQRHVFAYAIVNYGAYIDFSDDSKTVRSARLYLGGPCKGLLTATQSSEALLGRQLDQETFVTVASILRKEIAKNPSGNTRHRLTYRQDLAVGFLYKTFLAARTTLPPRLTSAILPFVSAASRPVSTGTESWQADASEAPVSTYVPKLESRVLASGEAVFVSDCGKGELFGQLVISSAANSKLVSLDASEALSLSGVHDFIGASAIPGINCPCGSDGGDNLKEKLFYEVGDTIPCVGAVLGLIVADTWPTARDAAKKVVQRYAGPGGSLRVLTGIEDVVALGRSTFGSEITHSKTHSRRVGRHAGAGAGIEVSCQTEAIPEKKTTTAKATLMMGAQSHFYMETQTAYVTPLDGDCFDVLSSTQAATNAQKNLALTLKVPLSNINIRVPRVGGGFGGKLERNNLVSSAAAVAARRLRRPVRIQNERSDDMQMVGGRQSMDVEYEATFDDCGRVDSLNMHLKFDPGWFLGDCGDDLSMAVGFSDNCYSYRNFKVTTEICETDTYHNTSMRAPGAMQTLIASDVIMEHVAKSVGKPLEEVQRLNFYKPGDKTPYGDVIGSDGFNWTLPCIWEQLGQTAEYEKRKQAIDAYNKENRWTKKGIAMSGVKYVMDISGSSYCSGALICIYADGTVLVSSGGIEVGQGLNTKVAMCVAQTLDAPLDMVTVGPAETSKTPNANLTGGSGTSETSAKAAMQAAQELALRLQKYRTDGKSWKEIVAEAIHDKVCLVESAWWTGGTTSNAHQYATQGVGISEVLLDVVTGEVRIEQVDILMDLGIQMDAAVDIGQCQGGFVMALGYLLTEECKVDEAGRQLNLGTWNYKIPTAYDIPLVFNMSLLKDSPNPVGIKGSKACAEPVMGLVGSTYLAIKHAIYAARSELGLGDSWFMLNLPVTPERARTAMGFPDSTFEVP